ncbi:hypothetical protein [Ureibacillus acetophenoni]
MATTSIMPKPCMRDPIVEALFIDLFPFDLKLLQWNNRIEQLFQD